MLTLIRPDDEDFKDYRIYLHEVIDDYDLKKNKEAYEWLKRGARKLMTKIIKVVRETDEGLMEFQTPIAVGVENPLNTTKGREDEMAFVDISFHPKMRPFLIALKSKFTTYDVRNILKLPSAYSIRIYELLKQYEKIGKRKFGFMELKEIIGAIEEVQEKGKKKTIDNYPLYGNFRQRVLLKAQRDLEKYTDIRFEFDPIKKGRKVVGFMFYIISNRSNQPEEHRSLPKGIQIQESPIFDELFPLVKDWIGESGFRKLIRSYPENQVRNAIQVTLNRLKKGDELNNVAGHIIALAKQTNLFDSMTQKRKRKVEKRKSEEGNHQKKKELESIQRQLEAEKHQKELDLIDLILQEIPEARALALEKVKGGIFARYFNNQKSFEENCENPFFLTAFRNAVKKEFTHRFEKVGEEYDPKIKAIKAAAAHL
jgi:plasmid replication initiation protein